MIWVLFLALFTSSYAQELKDAVQLSSLVLKTPVSPDLGPCQDDPNQISEISCESDFQDLDPKHYTVVALQYPDINQIPGEFKKQLPGSLLEGNTNGSVKVILALPNDNKLFALWGIIFNKDGDDDGFTHGSHALISRTDLKGNTLTLAAGTNVYTQSLRDGHKNAAGSMEVSENFTNESILKIMADNIQKNQTTYWKAGVGWQRLDSQNFDSIFLGSGQQYRMHHLMQKTLGPKMAYEPIYKPDGKGIRDGISLEAFFGLQKNFVFGNGSCRVKTALEAGGQVGTVNSSYFQTKAGTYFFFQKPRSKFGLMFGTAGDIKAFNGGKNASIEPVLEAIYGPVQFGMGYNQTFGPLQNYAEYNTPTREGKNDAIMTMRLGIVIGRFKTKK